MTGKLTGRFRNPILLVAAAAAGFVLYSAFFGKTAAPPVTFVSLQGEKITTADLRGKVVLVNFWATTCTTCVAEMPALADTYKRFSGQGFETVAIAMNYDPADYVRNYASKNGLPFTVGLDTTGDAARGFEEVRLTPTSFLIDRKGRIVQKFLGAPDFPKLHADIEKLLAESA